MTIRNAQNNHKDCNLVFALSNDTLVRSNSFSQDKIKYKSHKKWYNNTLCDSNVLFFLVFDDSDERDFVGQIRFRREKETSKECIISLSITEDFRGKHIAGEFIRLGIEKMRENWHTIENVVAEVKDENTASNRLFMSQGFTLVSKVNTYICTLPKFDGGGTNVE